MLLPPQSVAIVRTSIFEIAIASSILLLLGVPATGLSDVSDVYVVRNNLNSGVGSLRTAIESGTARVLFDVPANQRRICLTNPLPTIMHPVTIDGGQVNDDKPITIDGSCIPRRKNYLPSGVRFGRTGAFVNLAVVHFPGSGIYISGGAVRIKNSMISGNGTTGIQIASGLNHVVEENRIGTNWIGSSAVPNGTTGLRVDNARTVTIRDNIISGNGRYGISINGPSAFHVRVIGNRVGVNAKGTEAVPNARAGILIHNSWGNTIGGARRSERNVISGNGRHGVNLDGASPTPTTPESHFGYKGFNHSNRVIGNYIGLDITGTKPIPNGKFGIWSLGAKRNQIGGILPDEGNVIAANAKHGIAITGSAKHPNLEQGWNSILNNKIGLSVNGVNLSNGVDDIHIRRSHCNVVKGNAIGKSRYKRAPPPLNTLRKQA